MILYPLSLEGEGRGEGGGEHLRKGNIEHPHLNPLPQGRGLDKKGAADAAAKR
jgi:hypothetical protein